MAVVDVVAPMMPVSALWLAIARWPIWLAAGFEYKCIMDVLTLSPWTTQVRAIYVNSIKGSCPK